MGGSASVSSYPSGIICPFVNDVLLSDAITLQRDAEMRTHFVEFVKEGAWADLLTNFEECVGISLHSSGSAWKRFGYKAPHCSASSLSNFEMEGSLRSLRAVEVIKHNKSQPQYQKMVMYDCYNAICTNHLFEKEELRSILIAALLPLFQPSPGSPKTKHNSVRISVDEENEVTVNLSGGSSTKASNAGKPKNDRLKSPSSRRSGDVRQFGA